MWILCKMNERQKKRRKWKNYSILITNFEQISHIAHEENF